MTSPPLFFSKMCFLERGGNPAFLRILLLSKVAFFLKISSKLLKSFRRYEDFLKLTLSPPFPRKKYLQKDQPYFNAQEKLFFSIKYNSLLKWSLAASGLFHMLTYKFYTFYCHILRSADVWKRWLIKEIENKKLFLSVSFTAKFELSFALTQENCIFLEVSF